MRLDNQDLYILVKKINAEYEICHTKGMAKEHSG